MPDLKQRAAEAMNWKRGTGTRGAMSYPAYFGGPLGLQLYTVDDWNPEHDHNHARLLYAEVVRRGLKTKLVKYFWNRLSDEAAYDRGLAVMMDASPAQLTEACCEILESENDA